MTSESLIPASCVGMAGYIWMTGRVSDSLDEFPSNFVHFCDECEYDYTQTFPDAGGDFLTFSVADVNNRVTETYHNNYYCQNI